MTANDAIKNDLAMGETVSLMYLDDLTDAEMMKRACPGINHIKYQVGHLISSENAMVEGCLPGTMPPLPADFAGKYSKEKATEDNPAAFHSKDELLQIYRQQRAATLAALARQSESDLDRPAPEAFQSYAPTVGSVFALQGSHWLMHCGQWAVLRRQLGRPPLM